MKYIGDELELFENAHNWKRYFASKISGSVRGAVLDVGAGLGVNRKYLLNNDVQHWCFLEPDRDLCDKMNKKMLKTPSHQYDIVNGTVANLGTRKFDTILYIDVLEHIEESQQELAAAANMLNDNGKLIVLAPAYNLLYSPFDEAIGHYRRYNKTTLQVEVPPVLSRVDMIYLDSLGMLASLINKYVLKQPYPGKAQIKFWDKIIIALSKPMDFIFGYSIGRSLIGIYKK